MADKSLAQQANDMLLADLGDVPHDVNRVKVYVKINGQMVAVGFAIKVSGRWMLSTEVQKQKRQDPTLTLAFGMDF